MGDPAGRYRLQKSPSPVAHLQTGAVPTARREPQSVRSLSSGGSRGRNRAAGRDLDPEVAGILMFIVLLALGVAWPWALLVGVAGSVAGLAMSHRSRSLASLLPRLGGRTEDAVDFPDGLTARNARRLTGEARAAVARTRAVSNTVTAVSIRGRALALCDTADRVVDELQHNPKRISETTRFLRVHLEAARAIISRYAGLAASGRSTAEIEKTLARVEPALDALYDAFTHRLDGLLSDEAIDLDVQLTVLEKTVQLDGLPSRGYSSRLALHDRPDHPNT